MATTAGTDAALVKTNANLSGVDAAQITPQLPAAEQAVRGYIGTVYDLIVDYAEEDRYGLADLTELKNAEALICGSMVIKLVNHPTTGAGIASLIGGGLGAENAMPIVSQSDTLRISRRLREAGFERLANYRKDWLTTQRAETDAEDQPDSKVARLGGYVFRAAN